MRSELALDSTTILRPGQERNFILYSLSLRNVVAIETNVSKEKEALLSRPRSEFNACCPVNFVLLKDPFFALNDPCTGVF